MTINTKFNAGDTVYTIENNEIQQIKISKIGISVDNFHGSDRITIKYYRFYDLKKDMEYSEEDLFHTVDELVAHMLNKASNKIKK